MSSGSDWDTVSNALAERVATVHDKSLALWNSAEAADDVVSAAQSFQVEGTLANLRNVLSEAEAWFDKEAAVAVAEMSRREGVSNHRYCRQPPNWLTRDLSGSLTQIQMRGEGLSHGMMELGEFAKQHSGFGGYMRSFFNGLVDPIDGVLSVFGNGRVQDEGKRLDAAVADGSRMYAEAFNALCADMRKTLAGHWEFMVEAESAAIAREKAAGLTRHETTAVTGRAADAKGMKFVVAVVLAVIIGLVVVAGLYVLRRLGLF